LFWDSAELSIPGFGLAFALPSALSFLNVNFFRVFVILY
jgi:hypothetical protein